MICIDTLRGRIGFVQIHLPYREVTDANVAKHRSVTRVIRKLRGFTIERNRLVSPFFHHQRLRRVCGREQKGEFRRRTTLNSEQSLMIFTL